MLRMVSLDINVMINNYKYVNPQSGPWTALVSHAGLEAISTVPAPEFYEAIVPGESFVMNIRPLRDNLEWVCDRLNFFAEDYPELAFKGLDLVIREGLIEIVGYWTGDPDQEAYVDERVRETFGVVIER